jgi:hypothetical protein
MPDQQDLSPDPGPECASNVEKNNPHRGRLRLACLRILCVHNGVYPDANFAGLYEIGDSSIGDLLRFGDCSSKLSEREEQARAECRENGPTHFHDGLQSIRRA